MGEQVEKNPTSGRAKLVRTVIGLAVAALAIALFGRKKRRAW
ncbi:MAG: hypothetical protein ACLFPU_04630 [Dehalococcoidia bacterium]